MSTPPVDPRLFQGSAKYYVKYRSVYPPLLIERVVQLCHLTPTSRVLDLGCGPGILARAFAPFCSAVIGVDPEPEMIAVAREYVADGGGNVSFVCASAHDLSAEMGAFSLVVIGRAFHWMDRRSTLETLETMIEPDGAIALFRDPKVKLPENKWRSAFDAVFSEFASTEAAHQGNQGLDVAMDEACLLRSTFNHLERVSTIVTRALTIEQVIGRAFSMAGTSPDDLKEKLPAFESAMRKALEPHSSNGKLTEITEPQALIARRWKPTHH